jgi:hypothetical protein
LFCCLKASLMKDSNASFIVTPDRENDLYHRGESNGDLWH